MIYIPNEAWPLIHVEKRSQRTKKSKQHSCISYEGNVFSVLTPKLALFLATPLHGVLVTCGWRLDWVCVTRTEGNQSPSFYFWSKRRCQMLRFLDELSAIRMPQIPFVHCKALEVLKHIPWPKCLLTGWRLMWCWPLTLGWLFFAFFFSVILMFKGLVYLAHPGSAGWLQKFTSWMFDVWYLL